MVVHFWVMAIFFVLVAGYILLRPLPVVETYELLDSSRLMDDQELDSILDRHGERLVTCTNGSMFFSRAPF